MKILGKVILMAHSFVLECITYKQVPHLSNTSWVGSNLDIMAAAVVVLLCLASIGVVLMCGGVGKHESSVVIHQNWHEQTPNNIDGEEESIQCCKWWIPQQPHSRKQQPHCSPGIETSCNYSNMISPFLESCMYTGIWLTHRLIYECWAGCVSQRWTETHQ